AERQRAAGEEQDDWTAVTEPAATQTDESPDPGDRVHRVGRIPECQVERDREDDDGDTVLARRHRRSDRDADETANGLDVQRAGHDVGEPIPPVPTRAHLAPLRPPGAPRAGGGAG